MLDEFNNCADNFLKNLDLLEIILNKLYERG